MDKKSWIILSVVAVLIISTVVGFYLYYKKSTGTSGSAQLAAEKYKLFNMQKANASPEQIASQQLLISNLEAQKG
jgi:hypothetical protein